MEKNTLVMVLDPDDPEVSGHHIPAMTEPMFGVVLEVLDQSGRYQEFRCRVRLDDGEAQLQVGRLVPLLILPEEELGLIPREAFNKWAALIMKRTVLLHLLPKPQRDFLFETATRT